MDDRPADSRRSDGSVRGAEAARPHPPRDLLSADGRLRYDLRCGVVGRRDDVDLVERACNG